MRQNFITNGPIPSIKALYTLNVFRIFSTWHTATDTPTFATMEDKFGMWIPEVIFHHNNNIYFNGLTLSAETAVINRGPAHIVKNLQLKYMKVNL